MKTVQLVSGILITLMHALAQASNTASVQTPGVAVWIAIAVVVVGALILILLRRSGTGDVLPAQQTAGETAVPAIEPEFVSALCVPLAEALPANDQWENRFEVKSTSSSRRYIVAQHRKRRHWSCSCPGWTQYRHCKHLERVGLPPYERPHEIHFETKGTPPKVQPSAIHPPELSDFPDIDLLSAIPPRYVVFDLETTGLDSAKHDIIEIGAILATRDSDTAKTFHALVTPHRRVTKLITEKTGITQQMLDSDGESLEVVIAEFAQFIGDLPLVSYGADFDMRFLRDAAKAHDIVLNNRVVCALNMARKAWPFLESHKLGDVANAGNFDQNFTCSTPDERTHRALGDCKRTLMVYGAAAMALGYSGGRTKRTRSADA